MLLGEIFHLIFILIWVPFILHVSVLVLVNYNPGWNYHMLADKTWLAKTTL